MISVLINMLFFCWRFEVENYASELDFRIGNFYFRGTRFQNGELLFDLHNSRNQGYQELLIKDISN